MTTATDPGARGDRLNDAFILEQAVRVLRRRLKKQGFLSKVYCKIMLDIAQELRMTND